jgi:hypothetical protein
MFPISRDSGRVVSASPGFYFDRDWAVLWGYSAGRDIFDDCSTSTGTMDVNTMSCSSGILRLDEY